MLPAISCLRGWEWEWEENGWVGVGFLLSLTMPRELWCFLWLLLIHQKFLSFEHFHFHSKGSLKNTEFCSVLSMIRTETLIFSCFISLHSHVQEKRDKMQKSMIKTKWRNASIYYMFLFYFIFFSSHSNTHSTSVSFFIYQISEKESYQQIVMSTHRKCKRKNFRLHATNLVISAACFLHHILLIQKVKIINKSHETHESN